jgi:hypothetical protein
MTETTETPTPLDTLRSLLQTLAEDLSGFAQTDDDRRFARISEALASGNLADCTPEALRWYVKQATDARDQARGLKGSLSRVLVGFLR